MRALIFTFGTRGDVDPYVALASRLQREGHAVTLSAPGVYREDLERRGIRFEPMGDAMHDEMRALMADSRGPVEAATLARRMSQAMRRSLSEQWTVAQKEEMNAFLRELEGQARQVPSLAQRSLASANASARWPA